MKRCTAIFLALITGMFCHAQTIKGHVVSETGWDISYASIYHVNGHKSIRADTAGYFTVAISTLPDTLAVTAHGYRGYKVAVTAKTLKDTLLEVVLLETHAPLRNTTASEGVVRNIVSVPDSMFKISEDEEMASLGKGRTTDKAAEEDFAGAARKRTDGDGVSEGFFEHKSKSATGKSLVSLDSIALQSSHADESRRLTAGELNDFNKWQMWQDFSKADFKEWSEHWDLFATERYCVMLQNEKHAALPGRPVYMLNNATGDTIWQAVTDNTGKTELWANISQETKQDGAYRITCDGCKPYNKPVQFANGINTITVQAPCYTVNNVDVAFVVDATGSMADELEFLKTEMEGILATANNDYSGINLDAAAVVYRDKGDDYITRYADFDDNLLKPANFIKRQFAAGGGDIPESVEIALHTALDSLHWSKEARTRLLFLVLDAPPHDYAKDDMLLLMKQAAAKGIRIIPIVCSGADKSTEFLMRTMALATNGTYIFLTDDSGIGESHIKPTTDSYKVELLSELLQRLIRQMVFVNSCGEETASAPVTRMPANTLQLKVMPNPTQGQLTVVSNKDVKEIFITDFTGKMLMRVNNTGRNIQINISNYPNGVYMLKYITADNEWGAEKIVLTH